LPRRGLALPCSIHMALLSCAAQVIEKERPQLAECEEPSIYSPAFPREKWQRKRTQVKIRVCSLPYAAPPPPCQAPPPMVRATPPLCLILALGTSALASSPTPSLSWSGSTLIPPPLLHPVLSQLCPSELQSTHRHSLPLVGVHRRARPPGLCVSHSGSPSAGPHPPCEYAPPHYLPRPIFPSFPCNGLHHLLPLERHFQPSGKRHGGV
jgi:hypothetical protein